MSHAIGAVEFLDKTILYYEYNGTADVVMPKLRKSQQEVLDNWRNYVAAPCLNKTQCQLEPVEVMTTYGGSSYWKGKACKKCMAIVCPLDIGNLEDGKEFDGAPDWSPFD